MTLKHIAGMTFAAMLLASAGAQADDMKIVKDGMGNPVKDSYGNCVLSPTGFSPEGCEVAPPPPPPAAPAPAPAPVVTPAPAPRVAPVVPKVKAKGNFKGAVQMDQGSRGALQKYKKR